MTEQSLRSNLGWIAAGIGFLALFWLLMPIMMPFVVGAGLAYLGDPIVDRLQRLRLSRTIGVVIVFVTIVGLLLALTVLVVPMLQQQLVTLIHNIPEWLEWLQNKALPRLGVELPAGIRLDAEGLRQIVTEHWSRATDVIPQVWAHVSSSGGAFLTALANAVMIPIVTFYLLRDWDEMVAWIRDMIPPRWRPSVISVASESNDVLAAFMRGQLAVMVALGVIYWLGLWIVGLNVALLIGIIAGFVSFVPYLGFAVGFLLASIAIVVQTQELLPVLWVGLVFWAGQMIEGGFLTPNLVGDRIGLHPVAVIFAVMAGGQLFGFIGVLLALPVAAVLAVMLRHAKQHWLNSPLYRVSAPDDVPVLPQNRPEP